MQTKAKPRPSTGRPTREQAEQRHEELLNAALEIFLERGFEQATVEEIAISVGMSKRTVYARYNDKAALFKATVRRAIQRYTLPIETLRAAETESLEETLARVARIRIAKIAEPVSTNLQRILSAQSYRFPELFTAAFEEGTGPSIAYLSDLFERKRDELDIKDTHRAAIAFLSLVVSGPARVIVSGNKLEEAEIETRIRFALDIFLNGVRRR